jgi:hypothetical protein
MAALEQLLRAPTLLPPIRLADAVLQNGVLHSLVLAFDDYHMIRVPEVHAHGLIEHLLHMHLV